MSGEPDDIDHVLAALADGTGSALPERLRDSALARIAESAELAAKLEDQRRAVALMQSLESVHAPASLQRSIERMAGGEAAHGRGAPTDELSRRRPSRAKWDARTRFGGARTRFGSGSRLAVAGTAVAVVAVVLALVIGGGAGAGTPTVSQASRAGLRSATRPAPTESNRDSHLLAASADGISYPYWGGSLGWKATGARTDKVGNRTVTTVFYSRRRWARIGYSIVSGGALAPPAHAARAQRGGVDFHIISHADPAIVTWRRAGHTCILTGHHIGAPTLMRLATADRA